jgi:hypothetical protein
MSVAAIWAWVMANEAAVATILLIVSEFLGAIPAIKANGILSFLLLKGQDFLKDKGGNDPTPNN